MNCLHVPQIMMPKEDCNLKKWSVVACDQYTSQPEYWDETEKQVGDAPSTLRITLPEVYLEGDDEQLRVANIHETMKSYVKDGILRSLPKGFMLVERGMNKEFNRNGLVVEIDLETYEYKKGEHSLIRPTEMTVEERIPPRLRVRQTATLELPHIMLLIDDPDMSIVEPLLARKNEFEQIYDTDLMQGGGHISGWLIPEGKETDAIMEKIEGLADKTAFQKKYNLNKDYPLLNLAVGDGNHSMATAKAAWENIKKNLTADKIENHPARYCLCEIVNIHDASLEVEPIHRVLFHVDEKDVIAEAKQYFAKLGSELWIETISEYRKPICESNAHVFTMCSASGYQMWKVTNPTYGIAVASIQNFLDAYMDSHDAKIDYIHGNDVVTMLGTQENNLGFFLPDVAKEDLFIGVIKDGVLPRKTFSMGEANEKRYYMECKSLVLE